MGRLIVNHLQRLNRGGRLLKLVGVNIPALCCLPPINGLKANAKIYVSPRLWLNEEIYQLIN